MRVLPAASDTPSVPPGSAWAFLAVNASTPIVTLADHARKYANVYFHSDADTGALDEQHLCTVASLAARTLVLQAGGVDTATLGPTAVNMSAIAANCTLVSHLVACLLRCVVLFQ